MRHTFFFLMLFFLLFSVSGKIHEIKVNVNDRDTINTVSMLDILGTGIRDGFIFYRVNATDSELLQLPAHIEINDATAFAAVTPSYSNLDEIDMRIEQMGTDTSGYGSVFTIGNSIEEREIKAIRISAIEEMNDNTPEILFVGLHHAREWISYEVPLAIAEFFMEYGESNPVLNEILNSSVLWFIPAMNPDGYLYSHETDRMWRNNRREHPDGSFGVDLNRNYSTAWIEMDYTHGYEPFSEPETQTIRDFVLDGTPYGIDSIDGLITYHSYGQMILYPPGSNYDPPENVELYQTVGTKMSDLISNECGQLYNTMQIKDLYLTFGEMTEWFMEVSGNKLSFTFELRPTFFENYGFELPSEFIRDTVKENIPAAIYFIMHIISKETDIDTDSNGNGVFDALEDTVYDYEECFIPEDEKNDDDLIEPVPSVDEDEDTEIEDFDDNDDSVDDEKYLKKSSGCSFIFI